MTGIALSLRGHYSWMKTPILPVMYVGSEWTVSPV